MSRDDPYASPIASRSRPSTRSICAVDTAPTDSRNHPVSSVTPNAWNGTTAIPAACSRYARTSSSVRSTVPSGMVRPVMSGLDFVKALRARPEAAGVPIIMVTTRGVREDVLAAVSAGVTNYIVKPFTPAVLKEKVDMVLSVVAA